MRRGLVHVLAWLLATGAAVTLSWWGVHTVMAGTAYDPPRALPVTAVEASARQSTPAASSTSRPAPPPRPAPTPSVPSRGPDPTASRSAAATPSRSPAPSSPGPSDGVRGYDTEGGRAVFDLGGASASLVSATPAAGWSMQVWKTEKWIRVEFASGADRVSVFCTWHDGPPRVDVGTY
ncbi:hypothetical protein [Streptomyces fumanus]|uniref:Secreted protein n=1 Tax=Streptomyces fumanus TaxID=67302 RepID=A0A919DUL2_9ACTN|nr:hypothetical protein [Streptomyces fumanus]GHE85946.1 hypothetical protein GCM10018772_06670 [Streptomyces fumanus]